MGMGKSPGWDRISVEYFKEFWDDLEDLAVILANRAFKEGCMNILKKGLIKPIPK